MPIYYILDDQGQAQPCDDPIAWGVWFERAHKDRSIVVAQDRDEGADGDGVMVSTVFLGIDHDFTGRGPPVLWETLVFGGPLDGDMVRYRSRDAAIAGHQRICQRVRG